MPRTLPWKKGSDRVSVPKREVKPVVKPPKRLKESEYTSSSDAEGEDKSGKRASKKQKTEVVNREGREPSTSPPPEAPTERVMNEGLEHDDKYRIVEDEFHRIAKRFTAHLHAAEYKRQEKMAKTRNAAAISSISRPVVGRMPDQTRRKVESVVRAKKQQTTLEGLIEKQAVKAEDSMDSDDDSGLPYVGTTLHGLMDSPRKKAISLAKRGSKTGMTRAAAGYQKPFLQSTPPKSKIPRSPPPKTMLQSAQRSIPGVSSPTASSIDDDDLDAHVSAPSRSFRSQQPSKPKPPASKPAAPVSNYVKPPRKAPPAVPTAPDMPVVKNNDSTVDPFGSLFSSDSRIAKRLEKVRQQKIKKEQEDQKRKKLDTMPSYA